MKKPYADLLKELGLADKDIKDLDLKTVAAAGRKMLAKYAPDTVGQAAYNNTDFDKPERDAVRAEATKKFQRFNGELQQLKEHIEKRDAKKTPTAQQEAEQKASQPEAESWRVLQLQDYFLKTYKDEIRDNKLNEKYKKDLAKQKAGNPNLVVQSETERLLGKKFAFNYIKAMSDLGYDRGVPYGVAFTKNLEGADFKDSGHSRLSAALLYSTTKPDMPPVIIELGDKGGYIRVAGTKVTALAGTLKDERACIFKVQTEPGTIPIVIETNDAAAKQHNVLIPQALKERAYALTEDHINALDECAKTALEMARKTMPVYEDDRKNNAIQLAAKQMENTFGRGYAVNSPDSDSDSEQSAQQQNIGVHSSGHREPPASLRGRRGSLSGEFTDEDEEKPGPKNN